MSSHRVEKKQPTAAASLTTASIITAGANLVSRLFGYVREAYIAALFGTGARFDLFVIASAIPDYLIAILLTALPVVVIPLSQRVKQSGGSRHRLFMQGSLLIAILLALICGLIWICRAPLIRLFEPSLSSSAIAEGATLTSILVLYLWFQGMEAWFRSWLYEQKLFWIPATSSILLNLTVVTTLALLSERNDVSSLAYAWLVCGVVLFFYSGIAAFRAIKPDRIDANTNFSSSKLLLGSLIAVVSVEALALIFPLLDRLFASVLPDGQIAGLRYATFLVHIPTGILAVTYATASFPWLSEAISSAQMSDERSAGAASAAGDASAADTARLHQLYKDSIRMLLFASAFVAAMIALLCSDLVTLAFVRGEFDVSSLKLTSEPLFWMTLAMPAYSLYFFLMRIYYAQHKRKRLGLMLLVMIGMKVTMSLVLVESLAHNGLAIATAISWLFCCVVMLFDTARLIEFRLSSFLPTFLMRLAVATVVSVAVMILISSLWGEGGTAAFWSIAIRVAGVGLAGGIAYLGAARLLGLDESRRLISLFGKRLS